MDRLCGSEIRKFRKVFVLKERTGVILTEIRLLLLLLLTGASAERRRMRRSVRRVRQSGQSRMRPGVALLDRSGVVVGERHRIRFRARRRLQVCSGGKQNVRISSTVYQCGCVRIKFIGRHPVRKCGSQRMVFRFFTLKLASEPFRRWRNSIAGLPGSVSDASMLSHGLHSRSRGDTTVFMLGTTPFLRKKCCKISQIPVKIPRRKPES